MRDDHDDHARPEAGRGNSANGPWRHRLMTGSTFLFGGLSVLMASQALKAMLLDQPRLERLIARGEQRPAQISNLQSTPGRSGGSFVDLAWTTSDGRACRIEGHQVSAVFLQAQALDATGGATARGTDVLVDSTSPGCTAVIAADVAFARARTGPGPLIGPLVLAVFGTIMGFFALRFARRT